MGAPGPRSCFRPWRLIPAPDLMPGVDVQVLEAGCGLQLPHRGVDLILLEGHCVPCELHRAQLRLQALQLPGGGEKIGDCWGGRFRLAGRQGEERLGRRRQTERGPGERRGSKREKQPHECGKESDLRGQGGEEAGAAQQTGKRDRGGDSPEHQVLGPLLPRPAHSVAMEQPCPSLGLSVLSSKRSQTWGGCPGTVGDICFYKLRQVRGWVPPVGDGKPRRTFQSQERPPSSFPLQSPPCPGPGLVGGVMLTAWQGRMRASLRPYGDASEAG